MKSQFLFSAFALAVTAGGLAQGPALAGPRSEQGEARRERRAGNILSIRQIEGQVLPQMSGMQYLGPEYDPSAMVYRLKFIQSGKVFFVDVDARSGRIIGRSR